MENFIIILGAIIIGVPLIVLGIFFLMVAYNTIFNEFKRKNTRNKKTVS